MSLLHSLTTSSVRSKKRVGRGYGSGKGGHTSSRGMKGQRSRGSNKIPLWFEGGQLPMIKRLPMLRGKGRLKSLSDTVTLQLSTIVNADLKEVTLESLKAARLIHRQTKAVKIVGSADVFKKITAKDVQVSKPVQVLIEKAGGKIISNE